MNSEGRFRDEPPERVRMRTELFCPLIQAPPSGLAFFCPQNKRSDYGKRVGEHGGMLTFASRPFSSSPQLRLNH